MPDDLELALRAADFADRLTLSMFRSGSLGIELKADRSPVTEADKGTEAVVRELVAQERPGDAVLGEEMGSSGRGPRRWLIDPIDGTVNFLRGIPVWATLLALEVDGVIDVGVVSAPALGRRWWARRGQGCYAGPAGSNGQRVQVSAVNKLSEATVSLGGIGLFNEPERVARLASRAKRDRGFGDFWQHVLVAEGGCEVALDPVVSIWDIAPLQVIVEEAGGRFTNFSGERQLDGGNALSSNGALHDEIVSALSLSEDQK